MCLQKMSSASTGASHLDCYATCLTYGPTIRPNTITSGTAGEWVEIKTLKPVAHVATFVSDLVQFWT